MIDQTIATGFNRAMACGKAEILEELVRLLTDLPGVLDTTLLAVSADRKSVSRIATSNQRMFPCGGGEMLDADDPWVRRIMGEKKPVIADGREGLARYLTNWEAIEAEGYGASGSFPVVIGGQVMGTVNILAAQGYFTPDRVVMIEALLPFVALALLMPSAPRPERPPIQTFITPHGTNRGRNICSSRRKE